MRRVKDLFIHFVERLFEKNTHRLHDDEHERKICPHDKYNRQRERRGMNAKVMLSIIAI